MSTHLRWPERCAMRGGGGGEPAHAFRCPRAGRPAPRKCADATIRFSHPAPGTGVENGFLRGSPSAAPSSRKTLTTPCPRAAPPRTFNHNPLSARLIATCTRAQPPPAAPQRAGSGAVPPLADRAARPRKSTLSAYARAPRRDVDSHVALECVCQGGARAPRPRCALRAGPLLLSRRLARTLCRRRGARGPRRQRAGRTALPPAVARGAPRDPPPRRQFPV